MTTGPIPEVFDRNRLLAFLEEHLNLTGSGDCCDEKGPDGALRYNNDGTLTGSAKVRFDGTDLIADSFKVSDLTPTRLIVAGSSGHLEDNAALTFDGTRLDTPILSASSTIFTSQVTASEGAYFADRVGIGTATPKMSLEILDPTGQIRLSENDTDNATLSHRLGKFTISVCGGGGDPMVVQAGAVGVVDGGNDLTPTAMFHASSSYDDVSLLRLDSATREGILFVTGSGRVGIGTSDPEAYLEIKNTVDDGTTNRTMLRLYNSRADDADANDFGSISIDFEVENLDDPPKSGIARIAAVSSPSGSNHATPAGEKTSGLIFSTMADNNLAEAMRIDMSGNVGIGTTDPSQKLTVSGTVSASLYTGDGSSLTGIPTVSGTPANNYIPTFTGTGDTMQGESKLQYNGTTLTVGVGDTAGAMTVTGLTTNKGVVHTSTGGSVATANNFTYDSSTGAFSVGDGTNTLSIDGAGAFNFTDGTNSLGFNDEGLNSVSDPTGLDSNTGVGTIVIFGTLAEGVAPTAGALLALWSSDGYWHFADADDSKSVGLLAIALGNSIASGLMLDGFFNNVAGLGEQSAGAPVFMSSTAGEMTLTKPTTPGQIVRVVGNCTNASNPTIYFNPGADYSTV